MDCRQDSSVEKVHSRKQLAVQQVTCELVHCREEAKHSMTISPTVLFDGIMQFIHNFCIILANRPNWLLRMQVVYHKESFGISKNCC